MNYHKGESGWKIAQQEPLTERHINFALMENLCLVKIMNMLEFCYMKTTNSKIVMDKETAKQFNQLARLTMINKLLVDIRKDLAICEIEGWDKKEYIQMIKNEINKIG